MKLIVTEKPSVAKEIAHVTGAVKRKTDKSGNGYYEGGGYYVSWCYGHLISMAQMEEYREDYKEWSLSALPFIPSRWIENVSEKTAGQYAVLDKLMSNSSVTQVICATDADREGELIFRLVYNHAGCKKPVKRLWISSVESDAIRSGLANMKDGEDYENLYYAALARQRADFLVGINFTRAFTCKYNKLFKVGRVQTPTVNLIVKRQQEIENFIPVPFWTVTADTGLFTASARFDSEKEAAAVSEACSGKTGTVADVHTSDKRISPPALFDLTTLQREANKLFGLTAGQVLSAAQKLYERKLLTYPRTDSRFITEDMREPVLDIVTSAVSSGLVEERLARLFLNSPPNINAVVNNAKVSGHHAIVPTKTSLTANLTELSAAESKVYYLVLYRLIAALSPSYKYKSTSVVLTVENTQFRTTGSVVISEGFKSVETIFRKRFSIKSRVDDADSPGKKLPSLSVGDKFPHIEILCEKGESSPPAPYTDASLLQAMENIGRTIEDDDLRAALTNTDRGGNKKGLGTPATRAGIIEKIVSSGYVVRKGKQLLPTKYAELLIKLVPEEIKSPVMTAEWEMQLEQISRGETSYKHFMSDIESFVTGVIFDVKSADFDASVASMAVQAPPGEVIGTCPLCGADFIEKSKVFCCSDNACGAAFWKTDKFFSCFGKKLTKPIVKSFLTHGYADVKGLHSKSGKTFDSRIYLSWNSKYPRYSFDKPEGAKEEPSKVYGKCPVCGGNIIATKFGYGCSCFRSNGCAFVIPGTIAGKKISVVQVKKLLSDGLTDEITGFKARSGKKFSARLTVLDGRVTFDFNR